MSIQTIFFVILFLIVIIPTTSILAQQTSSPIVWDEASKTWISAPAATPAPVPVVAPTAAPAAAVDLTTLTAVITPIIAAIAGIFIKNKKDMEKKDEEVKLETIKAIEQVIVPKLKQIAPVAEQTAKQDVKINQLAEELYKLMAEKANEIHDKPEIQQQKLIEDIVRSRMIAEQTKESGASSIVWDEASKTWISK